MFSDLLLNDGNLKAGIKVIKVVDIKVSFTLFVQRILVDESNNSIEIATQVASIPLYNPQRCHALWGRVKVGVFNVFLIYWSLTIEGKPSSTTLSLYPGMQLL